MSRSEKALVRSLSVRLKPPSQHGNTKAQHWKYFGVLCNDEGKAVDETRVHCKICLEEQQLLGDKGHISSVASFASTTSSSNMNTHLSSKHNICVMTDEKTTKIVQFLKPKDAAEGIGAQSNYEVARKMVLWFCRDLIPFEAASKGGFMNFFSNNVPFMHVPSTDTLRKTALDDVFHVVRRQLKERLLSVRSIFLMFDGWPDRYRVRPYLGIRVSYLCDWKYEIATLGCYVLPSHTGRDIANLVTQVLKEYFPDLKKIYITSSRDGAKNVVLASKLLKVEYYQYCLAHVLHLLLSADSSNNISEVAEVVQKCRNIVTALHFKSQMIDDELAATDDKRVVDELVEKMSSVIGLKNWVGPKKDIYIF